MTEKKKKDKKQELEKEAVEKENVTQADTVENADTEGEKLAEEAAEVLSDTDKFVSRDRNVEGSDRQATQRLLAIDGRV